MFSFRTVCRLIVTKGARVGHKAEEVSEVEFAILRRPEYILYFQLNFNLALATYTVTDLEEWMPNSTWRFSTSSAQARIWCKLGTSVEATLERTYCYKHSIALVTWDRSKSLTTDLLHISKKQLHIFVPSTSTIIPAFGDPHLVLPQENSGSVSKRTGADCFNEVNFSANVFFHDLSALSVQLFRYCQPENFPELELDPDTAAIDENECIDSVWIGVRGE
ncbi:hypothetical protein BDP27DRAFT_1368235 [Rhodocollybia butyracea]|uniref:Uncharacterized protein n=1 Tax=Rhodocollybia butyracea TaxID=206335 RepID=A0A9P5PG07_9AGAR|nr:hypothetical protein BDP27DRAFT_1368235 [Rhodocollybia butyracea]